MKSVFSHSTTTRFRWFCKLCAMSFLHPKELYNCKKFVTFWNRIESASVACKRKPSTTRANVTFSSSGLYCSNRISSTFFHIHICYIALAIKSKAHIRERTNERMNEPKINCKCGIRTLFSLNAHKFHWFSFADLSTVPFGCAERTTVLFVVGDRNHHRIECICSWQWCRKTKRQTKRSEENWNVGHDKWNMNYRNHHPLGQQQ